MPFLVRFASVDWVTRWASLFMALFYVFVLFWMPEWEAPRHFMLPQVAILNALMAYASHDALKLGQFFKVVLSAAALTTQAICHDTSLWDTTWGVAIGCPHHSVAKVVVLAVHLAADLLTTVLILRNSRDIFNQSHASKIVSYSSTSTTNGGAAAEEEEGDGGERKRARKEGDAHQVGPPLGWHHRQLG